jgi:hypothetical protein
MQEMFVYNELKIMTNESRNSERRVLYVTSVGLRADGGRSHGTAVKLRSAQCAVRNPTVI